MQSTLAPGVAPASRHNLRGVFARRGFRRLLGVRLLSQVGDGWFQGGLASSVFFNPQRAASPIAIVTAFAVLLVPYSTLGPFVGVFLDRWSRRNTLFIANAVRALLVLPAAASVWAGREDLVFILSALGVVALNRYFLAGIAAAQPHVVDADWLVTANSVVGPAGTVVYACSLASAGVAFRLLGSGVHGYAIVAACAAGAYALSAIATLTYFGPTALGPDEAERPVVSLWHAIGDTARGLVAGLRHLAHHRTAATIMLAQVGQRGLYGALTIMTLLLYRNFYHHHNPGATITGLLRVTAAAAVGAFLAALITPPISRRYGGWRWVAAMMFGLAVIVPVLGLPHRDMLTVALAFIVSTVAQSTKIVTDTALQSEIEDDYRGRVFSVNDTGFNLAYVLGLLVGAMALPDNGYSPLVVISLGVGYAALSAWFSLRYSTLIARARVPTP